MQAGLEFFPGPGGGVTKKITWGRGWGHQKITKDHNHRILNDDKIIVKVQDNISKIFEDNACNIFLS